VSSVLHPVGPEDKGTYWRRRLVVVVSLVVVVVLVALAVRALTTPDDARAQGPTKLDPSTVATTDAQTPTGTPTGTASGTPSDSATASGTATDTATGSATGTAATTACSDQSLTAVLTTKATTYGPGQAPNLVLTLENTSQTPCTVESSSAVRVLTITDSRGTKVWSSADCQTKGATATEQLDPGEKSSKNITWSRQHSAAGCPTGQTAVEPGTYTVTGTWDGVAAAPLTFALAG
jgi:hypothetical protein